MKTIMTARTRRSSALSARARSLPETYLAQRVSLRRLQQLDHGEVGIVLQEPDSPDQADVSRPGRRGPRPQPRAPPVAAGDLRPQTRDKQHGLSARDWSPREEARQ